MLAVQLRRYPLPCNICSEEQCAICYEPLATLDGDGASEEEALASATILLTCGHRYHASCFSKFMRRSFKEYEQLTETELSRNLDQMQLSPETRDSLLGGRSLVALREQGKLRQCPECGFGPVLNMECNDMQAHHASQQNAQDRRPAPRRSDTSRVTNHCPKCRFFSPSWEDWDRWTLGDYLQAVFCPLCNQKACLACSEKERLKQMREKEMPVEVTERILPSLLAKVTMVLHMLLEPHERIRRRFPMDDRFWRDYHNAGFGRCHSQFNFRALLDLPSAQAEQLLHPLVSCLLTPPGSLQPITVDNVGAEAVDASATKHSRVQAAIDGVQQLQDFRPQQANALLSQDFMKVMELDSALIRQLLDILAPVTCANSVSPQLKEQLEDEVWGSPTSGLDGIMHILRSLANPTHTEASVQTTANPVSAGAVHVHLVERPDEALTAAAKVQQKVEETCATFGSDDHSIATGEQWHYLMKLVEESSAAGCSSSSSAAAGELRVRDPAAPLGHEIRVMPPRTCIGRILNRMHRQFFYREHLYDEEMLGLLYRRPHQQATREDEENHSWLEAALADIAKLWAELHASLQSGSRMPSS